MNTQEKKWYDSYLHPSGWIGLAIYVCICVGFDLYKHASAISYVIDFTVVPAGWFLGSFLVFHATKWWRSR